MSGKTNKYCSLAAILVLLSIQFSSVVRSQGSWEKIDVPVTTDLRSVCFADSLTGWIAGDEGTMLHTGDGGDTWVMQETGIMADIRAVFFLDRNLGWAAAHDFSAPPYGTILLKTTDGGDNWSTFPYPEKDLFMNCIFFLDSLSGWMGGSPHAIVKTTDGGLTWAQAAIDTSTLAFFPVLNIAFYNDQYGYASGGIFDIAGVTWRTSDGGNRWYAIDPSEAPADEVRGLHLFDSISVIGSGGDPDFGYGVGLLRTVNGGENWSYTELGMQGIAYDIDYRNDTEAWAPLGPRGVLIYSLDGGASWTETESPEGTAIHEMTFPDSLHGYAVGRAGAVIRYLPPVPVGMNQISDNDRHITLQPPMPNPFRDRTAVKFEISDAAQGLTATGMHIALTVKDVSGRKVSTLADKDFLPGNHRLHFDGSNLPEGIYFLELLGRVDSGAPVRMIRRMVLVR